MRELLRVVVEVGGLLLAAYRIRVLGARRSRARKATRERRRASDLAHEDRPAGDTAAPESVHRPRSARNVRHGERRVPLPK